MGWVGSGATALFLLLAFPGPVFGTPNQGIQESDDPVIESGFEHSDEVLEPAEVEAEKRKTPMEHLDAHKQSTEQMGQRAVRWVDSFFGNESHEAEVASTQIRVRPELFYRQEQGWKANARVRLKIRLPNLERRGVALFAGNDDNEGEFDDGLEEDDEFAAGLQFFGKKRQFWHTSLSVGLKFNEFAGFLGPRFRYFKPLNDRSSFRFTQKILWQTNNRWQFRTRFDYTYATSRQWLFRQTVDGRWRGERSDEEGYRTKISSFMTRGLPRAAGLQGEFTTIIHTRPDTHVNEYRLALRWRQRAWRDWFYYEIVPQVAWEDEFDYRTNLGIRFRVEVFYGEDKSTQFWKRELEDNDEFRW